LVRELVTAGGMDGAEWKEEEKFVPLSPLMKFF
jgi:hypothetical protein